jgi:hypothetical protein
MTGPLSLHPLEILFRMSPLAFIQSLLYSYLSGEVISLHVPTLFPLTAPTSLPIPSLYTLFSNLSPFAATYLVLSLLGNGLLAFVLNVASFETNKRAGALTMTVCGNVKQCLTVLLGIVVFGVQVGWGNGFGMAVTLMGAAWYSFIELRGRRG